MLPGQEYLDSKILIVDDLKENVRLLNSLLKSAGYYDIYSTTDPREVLEIYQDTKPDLVLLDLNMPHLNGFQVMEQIMEVEKDSYASIMILTAQADQEVRIKALEAGAQDFLSKPFNLIEVNLRIRKMLEIKSLNKQVLENNQNLEKAVRERTLELEETRMETIYRLGRAAEFRDNDTGMHVVRMSLFSQRLAEEFGLDREECKQILHASPMHDVGKIGVPDQILLKPGKLNEEEWAIMKKHPEIGAEILSGSHSSVMQLAETISLTHQERWDGSGYPNNLKGEEIPLSGRIVAICDVFDALTSKRYYKEAFSVEKAMEIIEQGSGKDFEPYLVDTFKKVLPEMIRIVKELPDNEPADTLKVYRKSSSDDAAQKIHL